MKLLKKKVENLILENYEIRVNRKKYYYINF